MIRVDRVRDIREVSLEKGAGIVENREAANVKSDELFEE